jgi:hypothetical protein
LYSEISFALTDGQSLHDPRKSTSGRVPTGQLAPRHRLEDVEEEPEELQPEAEMEEDPEEV